MVFEITPFDLWHKTGDVYILRPAGTDMNDMQDEHSKLGLKYKGVNSKKQYSVYTFEIINKEKFLWAKLKYGL